MPARSKSQQRLFGMVHAYQKGKLKDAPESVKEIARSISDEDAEHFAKTKHKGLPEKKAYERGFMDKCAEFGVDPVALVKMAKSLAEYLFDVSPDIESGGNGLSTRSIERDFNSEPIQRDYKGVTQHTSDFTEMPTIQRLRQADGSVRYRVTRRLPTANHDRVGRTITENFSVVVDSPFKAMRLAKGNIAFDQETKKLLEKVQKSRTGKLISDLDLANQLQRVPDFKLEQFKPPKQFGLHVTKPGVSSIVKKVKRMDVQEQAPKVLKRLNKLNPRMIMATGGLAALPVAGVSLYALNKRRKERSLIDKIKDMLA